MAQRGFYLDTTRCTGCKTCEMACKDYKDLATDIAYRKIYDYEGGSINLLEDETVDHNVITYHVSLACQHCNEPACVAACPTTAMHKEPDPFGLVLVDATKCIGCGYCTMACPYNVPKVDRVKGFSVKCDGCVERLEQGMQTICVESCPLRALDFDDIDVLRQKHGTTAAIAPLPETHYTNPNLVIKPCEGAQEPGSKQGIVANPSEVLL